jgi:hypothetical protein
MPCVELENLGEASGGGSRSKPSTSTCRATVRGRRSSAGTRASHRSSRSLSASAHTSSTTCCTLSRLCAQLTRMTGGGRWGGPELGSSSMNRECQRGVGVASGLRSHFSEGRQSSIMRGRRPRRRHNRHTSTSDIGYTLNCWCYTRLSVYGLASQVRNNSLSFHVSLSNAIVSQQRSPIWYSRLRRTG